MGARAQPGRRCWPTSSLSLRYYRDAGMQRWVARRPWRAHPIDRIVVFSSPMAQYAEPYRDARRVVDFCDVDSDKWRQYADKQALADELAVPPRGAPAAALRAQGGAPSCDASLFVSEPEAELFRQLAPESRAKIGFFNNGVDTDYFSPAAQLRQPVPGGRARAGVYRRDGLLAERRRGAVVRRRSVPALLAQRSRRRASTSSARARRRRCWRWRSSRAWCVTGTVPDVRPYIAHADVAVAPLRIARGIQNKVLEAMAMARPVVVSPQALEGIDAAPGTRPAAGRRRRRIRRRRFQPAAPGRRRTGPVGARRRRDACTAGRATWRASNARLECT